MESSDDCEKIETTLEVDAQIQEEDQSVYRRVCVGGGGRVVRGLSARVPCSFTQSGTFELSASINVDPEFGACMAIQKFEFNKRDGPQFGSISIDRIAKNGGRITITLRGEMPGSGPWKGSVTLFILLRV